MVTTHCLLPGRNSRNTVVSRTRFPPAPKPIRLMKKPSEGQLGMAPATMVAIQQIMREKLKAWRRPMMSAPRPQNSEPTNMPQ
jgi:hypothetical protein